MFKNLEKFKKKDEICSEKYQDLFDRENLKYDLRGKSIRGGLSIMTGEGISFILHTGSMVVLARLLLPEQFGLISMVTALTGFARIFKDLGLSEATIQYKEITHEQISNLFWINLSISAIIMFIIAAVSPAIAWFYNEPRLTWISLALSCSFFFSGLTVQHQALLQRQMKFIELTVIKILSIVISISAGIIMALRGFEYWALVSMDISYIAFTAIGIWIICRWSPSFPTRGSGVIKMLYFGRDVTGYNIVCYFSRNLDNIIIGRFCGAGPLGLYDRAYKLMMMPINIIQQPLASVVMPALSLLQNDPDQFRLYYKKFISVLSFVYMPLVTYLGIFSKNFILLILGNKWIEAVNIFRIFAIAAFIQPVATTSGLVMISCGKTKRYFFLGTMVSICLILAFGIGIYWGAKGVATAYSIFNYVMLIPILWYSFQYTPISLHLFFQTISLPTLSSLLMGLLLLLFTQKMPLSNNIFQIAFSFIVAFITYFGIWYLTPKGRQKLNEYCKYPLALLKR